MQIPVKEVRLLRLSNRVAKIKLSQPSYIFSSKSVSFVEPELIHLFSWNIQHIERVFTVNVQRQMMSKQ